MNARSRRVIEARCIAYLIRMASNQMTDGEWPIAARLAGAVLGRYGTASKELLSVSKSIYRVFDSREPVNEITVAADMRKRHATASAMMLLYRASLELLGIEKAAQT